MYFQEKPDTEKIIDYLFETRAMEVAHAQKPFFYTSGKIGPYYINTHFLYGSKQEAESILELINNFTKDRAQLTLDLEKLLMDQYRANSTYRHVIDILANLSCNLDIDFVSGGERRDFFFSIPVSILINKPHLSIFKDGTSYYYDNIGGGLSLSTSTESCDLKGKKSLHIADLVTEASSFTKMWLPVLREQGADMNYALSVVDRDQGGGDLLSQGGVDFTALTLISKNFFDKALSKKLINQDQYEMIRSFTADPNEFMVDFFESHPSFLNDVIAEGGKDAVRAQLCLDKGYNQRKDS